MVLKKTIGSFFIIREHFWTISLSKMFLTTFNIWTIKVPVPWTFKSDRFLKFNSPSQLCLRRCKTISKQWIDFRFNFIWHQFKTNCFNRTNRVVMSALQSNVASECISYTFVQCNSHWEMTTGISKSFKRVFFYGLLCITCSIIPCVMMASLSVIDFVYTFLSFSFLKFWF